MRVEDRLQYATVQLLARLPDALKVRLSGQPPIVIDGQQFDPFLQLLRSLVRRRHSYGLVEPTVAAGRRRFRRTAETFRGPITQVGAVREFEIPGPSGMLRVRCYAPSTAHPAPSTEHPHPAPRTEHLHPAPAAPSTPHPHPAPRTPHSAPVPLTVFFHGGGFVIGDLDTHDEPCRILCRHAGVHILSVDYRCAPEHPFPAAVDDARAAFRWTQANAEALGADPARISVGGDSAGATLAAVVALTTRDSAPPSAQLLIYPATDATTERPSWSLFGEGFTLTARDREAFARHYAGAGVRADDPCVSPLCAADLSGLCPAVVALAGFDILRDEGEAYARALEERGTAVRVLRFPALEHGFIHLTGISAASRAAMRAIADAWGSAAAAEFTHNSRAGR